MSLLLASAVTHDVSGALTGQGSLINGAANRQTGAITHDTTGVLVGPGAVVAGSATRNALHSTTGALVGPGTVVAGAATRSRAFDTSGVLTGQGATVVGAAARFRAFDTTGVLVGPGAVVVGAADSTTARVATGALAGLDSAIQGAADRQAYDLTITREMATQLYQIYLLHGLTAGSPLVVAPTTRSAGGLVQSVSQTGGTVSIATTANTTTGLPSLVQMIDELAALHGLGETLSVTATSRTAGAISQTVTTTGGVTTVTRV